MLARRLPLEDDSGTGKVFINKRITESLRRTFSILSLENYSYKIVMNEHVIEEQSSGGNIVVAQVNFRSVNENVNINCSAHLLFGISNYVCYVLGTTTTWSESLVTTTKT